MCLLVQQSSSVRFSDDFLNSVFSANRDGLGVMYAESGALVVEKVLPATAEAFIAFYRTHVEGRDCIWHARMQTHGDIDLDNCHPYAVTRRIALAHNGILSSGNSWDASKSDTWHFIRHVIEPALAYDEGRLLDPTWQSFIGSIIGPGNKFGLMTAAGDAVIINRQSGVDYQGAWLSNTYAWDSRRLMPAVRSTRVWSHYWDQDEPVIARPADPSGGESITKIIRAARNCYVRGTLTQWVIDAPAKAARLINALEDDDQGSAGLCAWTDPALAAEHVASWFDLDLDHLTLERDDRPSWRIALD
jgi:hypothetical protein